MLLLLGHGDRVWIEEVSHRGVAADQNYLLKSTAGAAFFEQPEQALHRDIDHIVGGFLACGAVNDVSDSFHRRPDRLAVGNISLHNFKPPQWFGNAVMAERSNDVFVRLGL